MSFAFATKQETVMDPLRDVTPLCPCWIILKDDSKFRCDMPVTFKGDALTLYYVFLTGRNTKQVLWYSIRRFESIDDPTRGIDRKDD